MLSFGVIGVSIRGGNVSLLEALTISETARTERLRELKEACGFAEMVYLQTCNRVEFYYIGRPGLTTTEARNHLLDNILRDKDKVAFEPADLFCHGSFRALRHLNRVSASLDSMMVGEAQILGQVKEALGSAQAAGLAGPHLGAIFSEAFRVAKKVRRETPMGQHAVSMINLLHGAIARHLEGLDAPVIAVVGVGPMSVKLAEHLRQGSPATLLFVNRTVAKAEELAARFRGQAISLADFITAPPAVDVIFSATSAEQMIVDRAAGDRVAAARSADRRPLLVIDFAIPRDIDPAVGTIPGIRYVDIPHFREIADQNRRERFKAVDAAERIIDEAIGRAHRNHAQQQFRPIMASTLNEGLAYAQAGLGKLFATKLTHLDGRDQEVIAHWVKKLVHYTNQLPLTALAEQTDTARGDCAYLAGYGCVRTRSETVISVEHPAANRCGRQSGSSCLAESRLHHHSGSRDT
jgi:glutamyl-tRNA reductase